MKKLNLKDKRIFLRADLNAPLENGKISNDYKLKAIIPTINHIQNAGGKVILATHIGRPPTKSEKNFFDENLSTKLLIPWLEKEGYEVDYEVDLLKATEKSHKDFEKILLLENLRFFNGERETNQNFAELLHKLGDIYINDAFGLLHRNNTSVTLLAQEFEKEKRSFGLLVEKEIKALSFHEQPFVIVLGGNKGETKMKMLETFLEQPKEKRIKTILVGGKIAQSLPEEFIEKAKNCGVEVILPVDEVLEKKIAVDIGQKTIEIFRKKIKEAKTIFANGTMGIYENDSSANGSRQILKAISESKAYSIIGGGNAVAATYKFGFENQMDFLSTGGGATLALLASKDQNELPAVNSMLS